jgi:YD repeat-containing protein
MSLFFKASARRGASQLSAIVSPRSTYPESPPSRLRTNSGSSSRRVAKAFTVGLCSLSLLTPMAPAFADPFTWQYGYDAMGRPTTVLDPNGLATYTYYDSLGRPIQTQQPPNTGSATPTTTSFGYNSADGLTQVTDPRA